MGAVEGGCALGSGRAFGCGFGLAFGSAFAFGAHDGLKLGHLILRQQFSAESIKAQIVCHGLRDGLAVAGQHDGALHTRCMQVGDGLACVGFHRVADDDGACIGAIHGKVHLRAYHLGRFIRDIVQVHQLVVAREHHTPVDQRFDAMPADLFSLRDALEVHAAVVGALDGNGDGMVGVGLGMRGQFEQLLARQVARGQHVGHREGARGQRAGLVEDDRVHLCQRLKVIAALHQDAQTRGAADAAEERQRHRYDQRAGA